MQRYHDTLELSPEHLGAVIAIGNFDGVHLGHQAVIARAQSIAAAKNAPFGVMTFEPHPRQYFGERKGELTSPFRLMGPMARAHRLEKLGVTFVIEVPFGASLAAKSAEAFARDLIVDAVRASHVVVGADFHFGQGREGDGTRLVSLGAELGFGVDVATMVDFGGAEISSTSIRHALSEGRPRDAAQMLGHWHRLEGTVAHGDKRGRDLGYPTANIPLGDLHIPRFGVYAVLVDVLTGPHQGSYSGAASIGVRPTFGAQAPNCETYLFDFEGDLYGAIISVGLVSYLRDEERFDGVEALITQMGADCAQARSLLSAL
ncbi:MAG: bifunctional riboflavin kinase/FAD synthetase [Pseudomonadota bacterium]